MYELMYFMFIVIVFLFAFGVSTQSLMYHNQELDAGLLKQVFFPSYFVIGGEYYTWEDILNGIYFRIDILKIFQANCFFQLMNVRAI
jgi:hypothetical protein